MTKIVRKFSNSKTYHIMIKEIDNQNIFYDDQDRKVFLNKLLITKKEYDIKFHSYCLMDNHVHMVIRIEKEFLSKAMQVLMIRYVSYFNRKYKRKGPLVQSRFKSKNIEDQRYFLEVCRYVHRNPENAGIAKTEDYEWSSYQEYLTKGNIVDKEILLHYFNNDINEFVQYTKKSEDFKEIAEFEMLSKITDEEFLGIIMKIFDIDNVDKVSSFFKILSGEKLAESIKIIRNIKGTNKSQVSRVIRINRKIIKELWES